MKTLLCIFITILPCIASTAREWNTSDRGRIDADFLAFTDGVVTLKRAGGQTCTLKLAQLDAADQAFVKQEAEKPEYRQRTIQGPFAPLIAGEWLLSEHKGLPYAIYGAKELIGTKIYPLVLALHGKSDNNENGRQVTQWMKSFLTPERYAKNPCIIVVPLCYQPFGGTGSGWTGKPGTQAVALIKELVKTLPVDKHRIYCIGHSMGGFGTCHLINTEPRLFAAGVAVSGCSGPETANTFMKVPLWLFHAADDSVVSPRTSRALADALKRGKEWKYTEYTVGGHNIVDTVFEDGTLHEWLFSKGVKK